MLSFVFCKQKTAYAWRISDWSSDVCSSDLSRGAHLCLDTRQPQAGDVFFACPGQTSDGRLYIQQAAERGAAAIVMHADGVADAAPDMAVPILLEIGKASGRDRGCTYV